MMLASCLEKKQSNTNSRLAGMYKLYTAENADSNGVWHEDRGQKVGLAILFMMEWDIWEFTLPDRDTMIKMVD